MTSRRPPAPFDLILASGSPRRREMMARAGLAFRVEIPGIDEAPRPDEPPETYARRAATDKARAVADRLGPARRRRIVVGCDTIVVLDGRILGKPRDAAEARTMLRALSGRTHRVMTGLALIADAPGTPARRRAKTVITEVVFRRLAEAEIRAYAASGDPMDKAGAYGIQDGAAHMVRAVRGSYTNVVGLPMAELIDWLDNDSHRGSGSGETKFNAQRKVDIRCSSAAMSAETLCKGSQMRSRPAPLALSP